MGEVSQEPLSRTLRIVHFNDVYEIAGRNAPEPVGGAARFVTAVREHTLKETDHTSTIVVFSGDALSPSPLSHITQGSHMPPVLGDEGAGVDIACIGNHDLDFGIPAFQQRRKECSFKWLCSNGRDADTMEPLGGCDRKFVMERLGVRIGFMGIISSEWLDTLNAVDPEDIDFADPVETADELAKELREQDNCDIVVAITHMRTGDDADLATRAADIDLILGGHDHIVDIDTCINNRWVVKSGTDFRQLSTIDVALNDDGSFNIPRPELWNVSSEYNPDPAIDTIVKNFSSELSDSLDKTVGYTAVDLDGRFLAVRTSETALGNMVADVIAHSMNAEVGLLNAGSLRSDRVHPTGALTFRDINDILPMNDETVAVQLTGRQLLAALENSVSKYPSFDGRFCQVSGIQFDFDPSQPPGQRIVMDSVKCRQGEDLKPLDLEYSYKTALKSFMLMGRDGYDELESANNEDAIRSQEGVHVRTLLINYVADFHRYHNNQHDTVVASQPPRLSRRKSSRVGMINLMSANDSESLCSVDDALSEDSLRHGVCPRLEGRICCVNPDEDLKARY